MASFLYDNIAARDETLAERAAKALADLSARVHGLGDDALTALVLLVVALDSNDARPELQRLAAVAVGEWNNRKGDAAVAAIYEEVEL